MRVKQERFSHQRLNLIVNFFFVVLKLIVNFNSYQICTLATAFNMNKK